MRAWLLGAAVALAACATATTETAPVTASSAHIAAAVADTRRPDGDRERDEFRRPAEMLAFADIGGGERVADLIPGGGYFTRLFAVAVGDGGHVYATINPPNPEAQRQPPVIAVADEYANVSVNAVQLNTMTFPEPLDVVWTAQNYHDVLIERFGLDREAINRAVFDGLKPGGYYIIIDHAAAAGTDVSVADQLHRINQDIVREQVEAAGFIYDGETAVLRNPDDARTMGVFDESIRGRTDQFAMRFRKPG